MQQLVMTASGPRVVRIPAPAVRRGAVLVRVAFSAVSPGTETAGMRGPAGPRAGLPERIDATARLGARYFRKALLNPGKAARRLSQIAAARVAPSDGPADGLAAVGSALGYSVSGMVVAVGDGVDDLSVGDRVACAGAGEANHADFVCVRRNLVVRLPEALDLPEAATVTLGAIALQAVRRADLQLGERVAVIGLGVLGQLAERLARASGCVTVGCDLDESRVTAALSAGMSAGASDPAAFAERVTARTEGLGADVVILAAATRDAAAVNQAIAVARRKGRVVLLGDATLEIDRAPFYQKELDLLMSTSYGPGRYDADYEERGQDYPPAYVRWTMNRNMAAYLEALARGILSIGDLIERRVALDEAPEVYRALAEGGSASAPIGLLLTYPDDGEAERRIVFPAARSTPAEQGVAVAMVGLGNFGEAVLLPAVRKSGAATIEAVVGRDSLRTANAARVYGIPKASTDIEEVLADPSVGAFMIATRHDRHAAFVKKVVEAGRHVFVEKPLAIDWQGLDVVTDALEAHGDGRPVLAVGFNRRFSPAAAALKAALAGRAGPVVLHYRVNAGALPVDHWTKGSEGGGRNIGEACHMYDLCRYLVGAPVDEVAALAIAGAADRQANENFTASVRYADGSLASVTYSSLGGSGVEKERIEVFSEGRVLTLSDFESVTCSAAGTLYKGRRVDKGHQACVDAFLEACRTGGPDPIPLDEVLETSALALTIEEML